MKREDVELGGFLLMWFALSVATGTLWLMLFEVVKKVLAVAP